YGAREGNATHLPVAALGEEPFMLWRRSYAPPPPPIEAGSEYSQDADPRYADLGDANPMTECLADVVTRLLPYWHDSIVPDLRAGRTGLLAAHGNPLRAPDNQHHGIPHRAHRGA